MLAGQTDARRRSALVTAASSAIALVSVVIVAAALAFGGNDTEDEAHAPAAAGAPVEGLHVGGRGCDDERRVAVVRDPAKPWCSLERAAAAAPSGSVIVVARGDYPALELSGGRRDLTFRAADPRHPPQLAGLELTRVRDIEFRQLRFTKGVSIRHSADVTITDNGFAGANLYLRQTRGVEVTQNRFRDVRDGSRALLAQGSPDPSAPTTEDLVVRDNLFEDIAHDAIAVYNGYEHVIVEGNEITGVAAPADASYHADAMQFMGGDRLTVRRNVLVNNGQGILVKDGPPTTHLKITRNLVTGGGAGLQLFNAPGARVTKNTIWGTRFGTIFRNVTSTPGRTSVTLEDNVLDQLIVDTELGASVSGGGNVFGRGELYGDPAYRGRPGFVDAGAGDYRISSDRPGAGIPRGEPLPGAQLSAK